MEEGSSPDGVTDVLNVGQRVHQAPFLGAHNQAVEVGVHYDRAQALKFCYQLKHDDGKGSGVNMNLKKK